MTTEAPVTPQEPVEAPSVDAKPEDAKGLRKQLAEAHKTIADQRTDLLEPAYGKLGLNPETGLGKAIAKEYDGPASFDALAAFAEKEYGHTAPEVQPESHPETQTIREESAKLEDIGSAAGNVVPPNETTALAKAEAEGDWATALNIKAAQIESLR